MSKTAFERASDAVEDALASDDNHPDDIARAVLLAIRESDKAIKDEITISGWLEDELKYDDVWQGTIDAILTTDATNPDSSPPQ